VRPVIVPDDVVISFEIEHRESNFLISLDSRTEVIDSTVQLAIRKADRAFNLIRLQHENYLTTLRNKLMWGIDRRNY
jgi:NAD+ kinase